MALEEFPGVVPIRLPVALAVPAPFRGPNPSMIAEPRPPTSPLPSTTRCPSASIEADSPAVMGTEKVELPEPWPATYKPELPKARLRVLPEMVTAEAPAVSVVPSIMTALGKAFGAGVGSAKV